MTEARGPWSVARTTEHGQHILIKAEGRRDRERRAEEEEEAREREREKERGQRRMGERD